MYLINYDDADFKIIRKGMESVAKIWDSGGGLIILGREVENIVVRDEHEISRDSQRCESQLIFNELKRIQS